MSRQTCCVPGCEEQRGRLRPYCAKHTLEAFPCRIKGCTNRVASWNRSRCCEAHRDQRRFYL